jgi:hypothetical protein
MLEKQDARMRTIITQAAIMIIMSTMVMAAPTGSSSRQEFNRDKTGTNEWHQKQKGSQVAPFSSLASIGSFKAERSGFEPEMPVSRHTGLAIRRFRPLSHLSEGQVRMPT